MNKFVLPSLLALTFSIIALPAAAQSQGDWTIAVGAHQVAPKSGNGTLAGALKPDVGNDIKPTVQVEYFPVDNWGVEVIAAVPFKHDIDIDGLGRVGSTKQLPPTVSLQYHFGTDWAAAFVGLGLNYTKFFSEKTSGALDGSDLSLKASWGIGAHAGIDFPVGKGAIRADLRWIDIDSKVRLDGSSLGTVNIDPVVYGLAYVLKL